MCQTISGIWRIRIVFALKAGAEKTIRAEGEKSYPNECCGFLLGAAGVDGNRGADSVLPVENARESGEQYHRFVITAEDFMRAEKEAQRLNREITGIYHSHPDHPASPSEYDREHALPFYIYLIVSVEKGMAKDLTAWELKEGREQFLEEGITIWQ
jgi:proteasome lid subunit RPN8/RPN11